MSTEPRSQPLAQGAAPDTRPAGEDDGTQRTPTVATPVPSDAAEADSAWSWWALHCPTTTVDPNTGQTHPAGASLWLDAAAQRLAHHVSRLTCRSVKLFRADGDERVAGGFGSHLDGFAARLSLGPERGSAVVALDVAAAQSLAAPLIADATGLQPPAHPGPTDTLDATALGLLEFLTLAGLDAVLQDLSADVPLAIESFGGVELLKPHPREQRRAEVGYHVHVGSARGELRVALIDASADDTAAIRRVPAAPVNEAFGVCFALPRVTLSEVERQAMAVGDVILLGAPDLPTLGRDAQLVTTTGWSLGAARLEALHPDHVIASFSHDNPRPIEPALALQPRLGRLDLTAQVLRDRPDDDSLRLPLDAAAPIELVALGRAVAHGEPVDLDGQLGVRLLSVAGPPAAEASA
ncbi:MAG: hypothetical protein AAF333_02440 [Planctomycetota bacterium]